MEDKMGKFFFLKTVFNYHNFMKDTNFNNKIAQESMNSDCTPFTLFTRFFIHHA